MRQKTEIKVGVLVLAAIAGFTWLTWKSGTLASISGTSSEYTRYLTSNFDDVDGLVTGAKVRIAGVVVGNVADITLSKTGTAFVHMYVDDSLILPANVVAQVASSGIIGEKFISLSTDFAPEGVLKKEEEKVPSKKSASVEDMAENFARISADLEQVTASLRSALGGSENAEKLNRIVNSMEKIGSKLEHVLTDEVEPGQVKNIVNNLSEFSTALNENDNQILSDLKSASQSLKVILADNEENAGELISHLGVAARNLANITDRLEKGEGTLGRLMSADSTALEDLDIAMADLKTVMAKLSNGEGTIGRLINDPSIVDKVDNALSSFSQITNRIDAFRTEVDFYGYNLMAEEVGKGRFELTLKPRPTRYYVLGVTSDGFATESSDPRSNLAFRGEDFGNELKYTMQFGHVYESLILDKDIGFRIGIKDSTFGVGVDTAFWGNFVNISADLYDLSGENSGTSEENPHLDLTAKVNLIDNALYAVGGYDNALSSKYGSPFIGLGFRFVDDDLKYMIGQAL
jgi:phospholipid/cholesterol/gamma-HCH transport system substrate-binding protein